MYNHNKAQQSKNRVHISWDILYIVTQSIIWSDCVQVYWCICASLLDTSKLGILCGIFCRREPRILVVKKRTFLLTVWRVWPFKCRSWNDPWAITTVAVYVTMATLSSIAALGTVTAIPPGVWATAGISSLRPSISVLHCLGVLRKSQSFYHFELRYRAGDIMCVYAYMYVYTS